ncbi:MAG: endopeptidase La [candidate division Zixibacteria bacterium 4484_93]|nr:MAG: endopeptidase La [candidate division Zixibacteria bacterium 4484_93]
MNGKEKITTPRQYIELPILPLRNMVSFPGLFLPLAVSDETSVRIVDDALSRNKIVGLFLVEEPARKTPGFADVYRVGVAAQIVKFFRYPDGTIRFLCQGIEKVKIEEPVQEEPYLVVRARKLEDISTNSEEEKALMLSVAQNFKEIVEIAPYFPEDAKEAIKGSLFAIRESPSRFSDMVAANLNISPKEKQRLLEELNVCKRLRRISKYLVKELATLKLSKEMREKATDSIEKTQREYFLREQLKAIKRELGEEDETERELVELEEKIKSMDMPKEAKEAALHEINRLRVMNPASAEYSVAKTYIDWLVNLPWLHYTKDNLDLKSAMRTLDEDHHDLDKVKERIVEYLAVRKLKSDVKGPILCFVGPPGVGKTSLGMSIARALGRKFVRISLGGMHDEAEIRGHRRTYVGALPGRIIQGIRRVGSANPVFMLDEIDKLGADFRGDPSSALLEVLDPEQNFSFSDNYLEVPFDLSKVLFIATANYLDPIPRVLLDRMEVMNLPGYTEIEKLHIARKFLIKKELDNHGLAASMFSITDAALSRIINEYTMEAGVRNLARSVANLCRKAAKSIALGELEKVRITARNIEEYLGPPKFPREYKLKFNKPGVATGLAWTRYGGEVLFIETAAMRGNPKLVLTGSLGDVMKESAMIALSFIRSNAERYGVDFEFDKYSIHIHIPEGAIPKDGPSAGVTIVTALFSLFKGEMIPSDIAMTGEITLRGDILPIGGLKEKLLAAHRAHIRNVIIPVENKKNLIDVPEEIKQDVKIIFVDSVDDVINYIFEGKKR